MPLTADKTVPPSIGAQTHLVRFYADDTRLVTEVGAFIDGALRAGGTGIVIASAEHIAELAPRLAGLGSSASGAWYPGQLIVLDAQRMLDEFMVDGWPDARRFEAAVGTVVANACARGGAVHAFGEMVALLCDGGQYDAAVAVEELWHRLTLRLPFSLFYAYPWRSFPGGPHAAAFQQICAARGDVGGEAPGGAANGDTERKLAMLEQRNRALEAELARLRESEHTLLGRERELTDFIENAAEGLHRVGADGTILWANRAELQMLGYRRDEYVGRHIAQFHVDRPVIEDIIVRLNSGETLYDRPARLRCKDGSIKHVLIHSSGYFEDGKLRHTRCFTRDATERHQRDQALAQRDRMLLHAPVPVALLMGDELRVHLANNRFCALFATAGAEGLPATRAFPALQGSELLRLAERVVATGEAAQVDELAMHIDEQAGDGQCYFKVGLEPLPTVDGACEGLILALVDVTEHVRSRVGLELAQAELRAASNAKDEFLAMLGHELRNPLSPIVTALQLLRMRSGASAPREHAIIERQVDHLVRLVDDLLDVSRVTRGKIELKIERVQVDQPVAKAVEMAGPLFDERRQRLDVDVAPDLSWRGDPVRLAQVLSNLLTNAARYTAPGGHVALRVRRDDDGWLTISVTDNGIGLQRDMLGRVFELFVQGSRGVDRAEGGLGIGLALVKSIVELHGGTVEARSEGKGKGSQFVVRLPPDARTEPDPVRVLPRQQVGRPTSRLRLLVVDDNVDAANTLGQLLEALGQEVKVFHEPLAALDEAPLYQPDVALLDIGLPVLDGYQLAACLRERLGQQGCRMIALTGYGQDGDRSRSAAAGFERHLVKPISAEQLMELVAAPRA
jgi:PAS domain S-box-containing protein